jgi:putative DNA primase/helicase
MTSGAPNTSSATQRPQQFCEEQLALDLATGHSSHLRYVASWGKWMLYSGGSWVYDDTLYVLDLCRQFTRAAARLATRPRLVAAIANAKTALAVEKLARSDRRLAATVNQWDSDPWLLNTPDGTVDLRTGILHPHRPEDYCTRSTAVAPAPPGMGCPLWLAFLARVMNEDQELIRFLQRMVGYMLTGSTKEHQLFFGYGTGRNGKSVFTSTILGPMGTYATVAPMDTFTESHTTQHPTELAMLRGARLVTAQETEEGRRWAEAKIKAMTGGDPISARFMRQDFFTFTPHFKLWIAGNHKPSLRGVDEAMRARLNLIPFTVTIPEEKRDKDLPEKLKAEWPAILRWAIEGCLEWQEKGLQKPEAVRAATQEYLAEEDAFALWLEECCDRADNRENTADLFQSWRQWAERAGEFVGSQKRFSQLMHSPGFKPEREGGTGKMGYRGVRLERRDYSDDPRNPF